MKKLHHWMVGVVVAVMHTMGWCQAPSATVWMMYQNYGVSKLTSEMMASHKFAKPEQACGFVNALYSAEYWVSEFVNDREYVCNYSPAGVPSSGNSNDVKVGLFCGNGDVVSESGMCVIEGMAALPVEIEDQSCPINNPTLPGMGTKAHYETHYQGTGKDPLVFEWSYKGRHIGWQTRPQGRSWMHNYARRVVRVTDVSESVFVVRGSGAVHAYDTQNGPPWRSSDSADELVIEKDGSGQVSGYRLKVAQDDSTEYYDATGRLLKIESRNGGQQSLSYDGQGRLVSISNAAGRQLTLSYNAQGDIASMTAPGGEVTQYEWNAQHQLTATVWPDGTRKQYHYEDPRFNGYLTGITDELGTRISRYEYTPQGEVAHTLNGLGQMRNRFAYQWQSTPAGLQNRTTVTDGATGTQQTLQFNRNNGERALRFAAVVQADGSTTQATERNAQGQPTRQVNPDGTVTFYKYNERGLEIERAQFDASFATATTRPALAKATSVTSTRWHATWHLPKEIAQPQLATSTTYNARGDVTGYSTQATTDLTGAQKFEATGTGPLTAMGYAYNANAQLARIVQLQDGTETARWTLGYNDQGDVQRITHIDATTIDPTTQAPTETTQRIPQHDPHGRPTVILDPDGNRTRLTYNERGALTRLVQGEDISHFTYDPRGVMTRIKTPDGSVFTLVYDADVNLTQVKHNGKAITAAYVTTLSETTKTTVAEVVVAFSWVFTDEVLNALLVAPATTDRQQAQRVQREKLQALPLSIPVWSWATGGAGWAGAGFGAWLGWNLVGPMFNKYPYPPETTQEEKRHWDRYCRNDDPCSALKVAINKEIYMARVKMNDMLIDKGGMFGGNGWETHKNGLAGRLLAIKNMINLAKRIGCDVSQEESESSKLFIPLSPIPK